MQLFQAEWTDNDEEAEYWGYGQAWSDDYANRIAGSDGTSYGRPVTDKKVNVPAHMPVHMLDTCTLIYPIMGRPPQLGPSLTTIPPQFPLGHSSGEHVHQ
jgi:hypothetical protein